VTSEVQRRIDQLGERLKRSVVLNDPDVRLVYSSQHFGDEDPVRIKAALHRDAGSRPIAHLLAQGVNRWTGPGRIPAAPDLGLLSRLLVPIRWHGELLGSVVVIDADESITPDEISLVEDFAREAAGLIVFERHATDQQALLDEEDTAAWLSGELAARQRGRDGLVSRGLLPDLEHVRVLVAAPDPDGQVDEGRTHLALRHAFGVVRGRLRGASLVTVRDGHGAFAFVSPGPLDDPRATEVADTMLSEVRDFLGLRVPVRIGIGAEVTGVEDAWLSRRQAELATRAVPVLNQGSVVHWNSLGVLQLLLRIPTTELDPTVVPVPVAALLAADQHGRLVETLEAYLRSGGAGAATASALHIHRTTLYYRLNQLREITGLDIDDGDARTLLQVGLAAHRLLQAS
jgi:hypothetical protein